MERDFGARLNSVWGAPCDRSHGCNHFQRSHNSFHSDRVLS